MAVSRRDVIRSGLLGGGRRPARATRRRWRSPAAARAKVGHPALALGRPAAPGHVRPQAGRRLRLLRPVRQGDPDERGRHPDRRAAARAGEAGRQVLPDPEPHARRQRPRDGGIRSADRPQVGRQARLPRHGCGRVALQGLRRRLQGPASALHRPDRAAGPLLGVRVPRAALRAVRHRRRPGPDPIRGAGRGRRPASPSSASATAAPSSTSSIRWARSCRASRRSRPTRRARTRPTN